LAISETIHLEGFYIEKGDRPARRRKMKLFLLIIYVWNSQYSVNEYTTYKLFHTYNEAISSSEFTDKPKNGHYKIYKVDLDSGTVKFVEGCK